MIAWQSLTKFDERGREALIISTEDSVMKARHAFMIEFDRQIMEAKAGGNERLASILKQEKKDVWKATARGPLRIEVAV